MQKCRTEDWTFFWSLPCLDLACNRLTCTQCSLMYPVRASYGIPGKRVSLRLWRFVFPKTTSFMKLAQYNKEQKLTFPEFQTHWPSLQQPSIMQREHSLNQLHHVESKIRNVSQDHEVSQSGLSMVLFWVIIGVFTVFKGLSSLYQHHPHSLPKLFGLLP